mmetsp:Transcript_4007/g.6008  ORF Transcript_4007/g.6008 Transcript_4007/m.6008 type:complete len:93 (+) Transcript_4007:2269-2547(+)
MIGSIIIIALNKQTRTHTHTRQWRKSFIHCWLRLFSFFFPLKNIGGNINYIAQPNKQTDKQMHANSQFRILKTNQPFIPSTTNKNIDATFSS